MNANTNSARFTNAKSANNGRSACKKFCKVCFDAGKPENVYTNHTVKTMNVRTGKLETTCVTLLALECRYCFTAGHTVKFCPAIKENNKGRKEHEIQHARERHAASVAPIALEKSAVKKGFALLQEESDDDDEVVAPLVVQTVVQDVDYPALPVKAGGAPKLQTVLSFAATAALPPKPKVTFAPVVSAPVPVPAPIQEHFCNDDSDYEEDDNEDFSDPQTPAVSYVDSCFSYRERHGYEEDNSW
jgi:hypothetical protein